MPAAFTLRAADLEKSALIDRLGFRLLLPAAIGFEEETDTNFSFGALAFVPGLEVQIPVNKYWALKPFAQLGAGKDSTGGDLQYIYGGGLRSLISLPWKKFVFGIGNSLILAGDRDATSKITIAAVAIIVSLPVIVLLAAEMILNSAAIKSEIESIVAEALEMEFKIEGRIDIRFWPLLNLAANDVTVGIKTGQIASADQIVIDPRLPPLLNLDIIIEKAHLQRPRLTFSSQAIDKIMALIETESDESLPVESLEIESFSISKAGFTYTDNQTTVDFNEMNFRGGRIDIIKNREVNIDGIYGFFKAVSFTGDITARQVSSRHFNLENLKASGKNKNGQITADPGALKFFGSNTKLRAFLDLMPPHSAFKSTLVVTGLNMKALAGKFFPAVNIRSKVDVATGISASGVQLEQLIDYVSNSGPTAGTKELPIKSVMVEAFTVGAKDLAYANDTITIDQAGLNLKGNRWALIENNRLTLKDFDSFLKNKLGVTS